MKLTKKAIQKILEGNTRAFLCTALNCTYHTLQRWINENASDGKLTTITALKVIEKETGLKQSEILQK